MVATFAVLPPQPDAEMTTKLLPPSCRHDSTQWEAPSPCPLPKGEGDLPSSVMSSIMSDAFCPRISAGHLGQRAVCWSFGRPLADEAKHQHPEAKHEIEQGN